MFVIQHVVFKHVVFWTIHWKTQMTKIRRIPDEKIEVVFPAIYQMSVVCFCHNHFFCHSVLIRFLKLYATTMFWHEVTLQWWKLFSPLLFLLVLANVFLFWLQIPPITMTTRKYIVTKYLQLCSSLPRLSKKKCRESHCRHNLQTITTYVSKTSNNVTCVRTVHLLQRFLLFQEM